MTVNELLKKWEEEDSTFSGDVGQDLLDIPLLHIRYYKMLSKIRREIAKEKEQYEDQVHIKTLYYSGRGSAEEYKEKNFDYKLAKSEIPMWIAADKDLRGMRRKLEMLEEIKECLKEIVDQIKQRYWILKTYNDRQVMELGIKG